MRVHLWYRPYWPGILVGLALAYAGGFALTLWGDLSQIGYIRAGDDLHLRLVHASEQGLHSLLLALPFILLPAWRAVSRRDAPDTPAVAAGCDGRAGFEGGR
jgi:hypothetical protein